jgi:hypothetical protein
MSKLQYRDKIQDSVRVLVYDALQCSFRSNHIHTPDVILFTNIVRHSINLIRNGIKDSIKNNVARGKYE